MKNHDGDLHIERVSRRFGGVTALRDVSFSVQPGAVVGVIGPNGAGKTTLFNVITGFQPLDSGRVTYAGEQIDGLSPEQVAARGIVRTFQLTAVFPEMSVIQNVEVACHLDATPSFRKEFLHRHHALKEAAEVAKRAASILESLNLHEPSHEQAAKLPYGQKKVLSIAIALAAVPKVLLLDEPVSGMDRGESENVRDIVRRLKDDGLSVIIVEHNVQFVMDICDRIVVLNFGRKLAEGSSEEIRRNPEVIDAYLGSGEPS